MRIAPSQLPVADARAPGLLEALLRRDCLAAAVPVTLALLQDDPLASGGQFRGDLLRALMEVRGDFWSRNERLYERYLEALRAAAAARRRLPAPERMEFWSALQLPRGHSPLEQEEGT
ncbi:MAG TPA: contact-dependent growth inhibition system immunity protein [Gemmatimonadaceae bacterium]